MTDDHDLLAAEVALGLVDPPAAADAVFDARVAWWADRLAVMGADVAPPATAWPAIAATIARDRDAAAGTLSRGVAAGWRSAALGLGTVAAGLLAVIMLRPAVAPMPATPLVAPLVAQVTGTAGATLTVSYDSATARLLVTPVTLPAGTQVGELWVISAGGKPRSLGLIDRAAPATRVVAPGRRDDVRVGATIAVSLEPPGGSPTSTPTGPVVATGKIVTA